MYELLIVDDEGEITQSLKRELRSWTREHDLVITTAADGREALAHLQDNGARVAIMLTDNRMPGLSGADLVRRARELRYPMISLILTGYTAKRDIESALSAGIFGFIVKPWDREDLRTQLGDALQTFFMRKRTAENERQMREEIQMAQEFQHRYFAVNVPEHTGILDIDYVRHTAAHASVGGDYLDIIRLTDDRLLFLVGDVAGHGLRATFLAAILKSMVFQDFVNRGEKATLDPAELMEWLNRRVFALGHSLSDLFVSFAALRVDVNSGEGVLSCAGSPFPLYVRNQSAENIGNEGIVLGINPEATYQNTEFRMDTGGCLFLFTDGITPQGLSGSGFREQDLEEYMVQLCSRADLDAVIPELPQVIGTPHLEDDVTLVRIRAH